MKRRAGFAAGIVLAISAGCGGDDAGRDVGVVGRGLREIPVEVYEDARGEGVDVSIGDYSATAAAIGLDPPSTGRSVDAVRQWYADLTVAEAGTQDGSQLRIIPAVTPDLIGSLLSEDVDNELGIDVGAMERFAELRAGALVFQVISGDLELSSALDDVGGGVVTAGSGEDGAVEVGDRTSLRPLGRPLRAAVDGESIALSSSTPAVGAWLGNGDRLADDGRWSAVAQALDDSGSVGAYLVESDFQFDPTDIVGAEATPDVIEQVVDALGSLVSDIEPYDLIGIGMAVVDDEPVNVVAYHFGSEEDAAASVDGVQDLWRDAELFQVPGTAVDDLYRVESVGVDGAVVTVVATPLGGRSTAVLVQFVAVAEVLFTHS